MIRDLSHIYARIFGVPLLIQSTKLDALLAGLSAARFQRGSLLAADSETPPRAERPPHGYSIRNGVATVPVHGVLVRRAGEVDADSTRLQSYQNLTQVLRNARADHRVRGILLDIDSPGGEAGGIFDFAQEIRSAPSDKPIWAIANDDALSAAYAIAAATQRVWITDTGAAGSIGVVALHLDQSELDDQNGLAYSYIFKGAHKIDANSHQPLTIEARAAIQGEIDRLYDKFTVSTAAHRRLEPSRLRGTEAQIYYGDNARGEGLVDDVGTLDQAHQALAETISLHGAPRGASRMDSEETNIVNLDEVRTNAAAAATATALEIIHQCELGRHPELARAYIANNTPLAAVSRELLELRAREDQARPIEIVDTGARASGNLSNLSGEIHKANSERFRAYQTPVRAAGL